VLDLLSPDHTTSVDVDGTTYRINVYVVADKHYVLVISNGQYFLFGSAPIEFLGYVDLVKDEIRRRMTKNPS
jgi:hypothetical protein